MTFEISSHAEECGYSLVWLGRPSNVSEKRCHTKLLLNVVLALIGPDVHMHSQKVREL